MGGSRPAGAGVAPVEPDRRVEQAGFGRATPADADRRDQTQGKPYGFYFEHVTGGYTTTGASGFQSFKVIPLVVYRVYRGWPAG